MDANKKIHPKELREILFFVAQAIAEEESALNALDSAIGDGDHGITMRLGFQAVAHRLSSLPSDAGIDVMLGESGRAFMGATGGAIGVILGKMLSAGMVTLKGCASIGPSELAAWLSSMESAVANSGKARPGDKTIMDSVHAASESASRSLRRGEPLEDMVASAAQAAETAAQNTANMVCRVGRASRLGERSLGHPDPGAVSFAIILGATSRWLKQHARCGPGRASEESARG
jgi:dihydroxyacetone kinase-like protein